MLVKRILDWGIYIGLLAPALVFVYHYVEEYLVGKTFFVKTTKPLTLHDLPVMTICFSYPFSSSVRRNLTHSQFELLQMELNNGIYLRTVNVYVSFGSNALTTFPLTIENNSIPIPEISGGEWILKESFIKEQGSLGDDYYFGQNCFKVMAKFNDSIRHTEPITNLWIVIVFPDPIPPRAQLTLSTEENSYGFDQRKWFDGVVQVLNLDRDWIQLRVADITGYQYMSSTCSKESFYKCLANRFASLDIGEW